MRYKEFTITECNVINEQSIQKRGNMHLHIKIDIYDKEIEVFLMQSEKKKWYVNSIGPVQKKYKYQYIPHFEFNDEIGKKLRRKDILQKIMEHPHARLLFLFI
jgi:hypothetical protein